MMWCVFASSALVGGVVIVSMARPASVNPRISTDAALSPVELAGAHSTTVTPPTPPASTIANSVGTPPPGINYALASNGATAEGGRDAARLIDGDLKYSNSKGFATSYWMEPPQAFVVKLNAPITLACVRFLLWDLSAQRFYRYKLEVNPSDKDDWTSIADKTDAEQECRGWQDITFAPLVVKQIRLTGTFNNMNSGFQVVELQAFSNPPPPLSLAKTAIVEPESNPRAVEPEF